ncbi:unnamed protein product [Candidula unifasciata]|uniref:Transmembrane protein 9 n=1 Tax=Candidula unifasciata TaxID=100452 RepID=A0A8S3YPW0_9EUPU|nr:unnamed protein product [Candidula unifasciata]
MIIGLLYCLKLTNYIWQNRIVVAASFEDARCRCVCKKTWDDSGNKIRAVFTSNAGGEFCDCEHVVLPLVKQNCAHCLCSIENRNTTTIKVVVIFIICVVSLLFFYMLFLICLDPLIQRRPTSYQQHTNEEVNLEDMSGVRAEGDASPSAGATPTSELSARQRSLLNIVQKEQKKWKGTVQEQRRNIYDRHSMLN